MQIWQDESPDAVAENGGCCGLSAVEDARRVAERIGIQHYVMNFREEFQKHVINYFTAEYLAGRTPNPCIACNRYIKWEALLNRSYAIGAEFMATGHYARIEKLPNGRLAIRNSVTARKDQTYALYNLTQEQLAHTLLPVGDYDKEQIRQIAGQIGLTVAAKPDSQDICFVPDGDYSAFLGREIPDRIPPEGNFVTKDGEVLGRHKGITHYTIGQRKGLGIALGHPVFVSDIRPETNEVVIGENEDIFSDTLTCNQLNFMGMADVTEPVACMAKVRYAHRGEKCTLSRTGEDSLLVKFEKPVRAITPGQAVVFYDGEYVLGGGTIL
jgi:tRNA-specific 2-thiouridylase